MPTRKRVTADYAQRAMPAPPGWVGNRWRLAATIRATRQRPFVATFLRARSGRRSVRYHHPLSFGSHWTEGDALDALVETLTDLLDGDAAAEVLADGRVLPIAADGPMILREPRRNDPGGASRVTRAGLRGAAPATRFSPFRTAQPANGPDTR